MTRARRAQSRNRVARAYVRATRVRRVRILVIYFAVDFNCAGAIGTRGQLAKSRHKKSPRAEARGLSRLLNGRAVGLGLVLLASGGDDRLGGCRLLIRALQRVAAERDELIPE